jgi:hypothetical protein
MDLNDMTPAGGGELRGGPAEPVRQTVGTFTPTQIQHPDAIWSPRGGELAPPDRPLTPSPDAYARAESERSAPAAYMGETPTVGNLVRDMHPVVRAALRPGIAG